MYEPGQPVRLGWLVCDPAKGCAGTMGCTAVVSDEVVASWLDRQTQISMTETFCCVGVLQEHPEIIGGRDVLWFIDNEAACSTLMWGGSTAEDMARVAEYSQLVFASIRTRVWWEWIDSHSNVADGLSRLGLQCPVAQAACGELREVDLDIALRKEELEALLVDFASLA